MEADLVKVFAPHDLGGKDRVRDADHLHNCMAGYSLQSHDIAPLQPISLLLMPVWSHQCYYS